MKDYETLFVESTEQGATVTFNRPEKRNAITTQMIAELLDVLDSIEKTQTRVVILTGSGKAFCAGIDLDMLRNIAKQSAGENQEDSRPSLKCFARFGAFRAR